MNALHVAVPLALLTSGCVAFLAPPVRASASIGATLGTFRGTASFGGEAIRTNPTIVEARVAAHPLAYVHELSRRRVDFGFGYTGLFFPWDAVLPAQHGGHAELGWYPLQSEAVRLQIAARAEVIHGRSQTLGGGGGVSVLLEVRHFVARADASRGGGGFAAGAAWGEIALGIRLDATARVVDGEPALAATAGLVIGAPATVAFAGYPQALRLLAALPIR